MDDCIELIKPGKHTDHRGGLFKVLLNNQIEFQKEFGEIYITTLLPGVTRGEHYHEKTCEWFYLVSGRGALTYIDIKTQQKGQVVLSEENPVTVKIPPFIAHSIENIGEETLYLLAYSDQEYDQQEPDCISFAM